MANWNAFAKKAYLALKKDGIKIELTLPAAGAQVYDPVTGKYISPPAEKYQSHGIFKEYEVEGSEIYDPDVVEILFHSGQTADDIPDLLEKKDIEVLAGKKIYQVQKIKAVRPAGVTIMYKAKAKEAGNAA